MIELGQADSIGKLLTEVDRVTSSWAPLIDDPEEIWFRGERFKRHSLTPTLYRDYNSPFHYDETDLFERFRALAAPYVRRNPANDWDWYFLARHHNLPSRLLDWSESLLVATYFAVSAHVERISRLEFAKKLRCSRPPALYDLESPCVWILDAGTLNKRSLADDSVLIPGAERTNRYLPMAIAEKPIPENEFPIALLPPRTNERIAAQQGVFTLHGHSRSSLDAIAQATTSELRLACILLDANAVCRLWDELQVLGIGRLGVFPELDSVAAHISWLCQSSR